MPSLLGQTSGEIAFQTTSVTQSCTTNYCEAVCPNGYYAISGSCDSPNGTRWNMAGISSNHQSWRCFDDSFSSGTLTAAVSCMKVGNWSPISSPSTCGNYFVESGEECDQENDSLCPGLCSPSGNFDQCTCQTGNGFCGDGVADSLNNEGLFEVCDGSSINSLFSGYSPPLFTPPLDCSDFLDPFATEYNGYSTYFPDCGKWVSCSACLGFDISQCTPTCDGTNPPWDPNGDHYPLKGGYPPGNYYDPNHPSNISSGASEGGSGPGGLTCGMSDPQRVNALGYPIGKDADGDGANVDTSAGEECDGGTPAQQADNCAGQIACGPGETPACGTGCKCECKSCEEVDWDGPTIPGNGTPPADNLCDEN
jgi:hypothetical protein